jgi:broad specificity phosphatase PhoE
MLTLIDQAHHDSGGNAIVVAHRGVIRAITERLANVSPIIELASIHSLIRDASQTAWRAEILDATTHLENIE